MNSLVEKRNEIQRLDTVRKYRKRLTKHNITQDNVLAENILSDEIYLISLLVDNSGSMSSETEDLKTFLVEFFKEFNNLQSYYPLLVSRIDCSDSVVGTGFRLIEDFFTDFSTDGGTKLYDAIEFLSFNTFNYTKELQAASKKVHNVIICVTDGDDTSSITPKEDVIGTMRYINPLAQTIYVYCGDDENGNRGRELTFQQVISLKKKDLLITLRKIIDSLVTYIEYNERIAITYQKEAI